MSDPNRPPDASRNPITRIGPKEQVEAKRNYADIVYSMQGKTFQSPVGFPHHILDLDCGMGVSTCHLGQMYPNDHVYDVDEEQESFPLLVNKPANVHLFSGDLHRLAATEWRLAAGSQDLIYSCLPRVLLRDWEQYDDRTLHLLRPGGYLEFQELSNDIFVDGESITGARGWWEIIYGPPSIRFYDVAILAAEFMRDVGFEDVHIMDSRWPWRDWEEWTETLRLGIGLES